MDTLIDDNRVCLDQGIELLERLDADLYQRRCPTVFNSAIGGHLRHNTDHYEQFLAGYATGRIDYDARTRDAAVEQDPEYAINLLRSLKAALESVPESALDAAVEVRMDGGESSAWTASSVRRELQFLISHTIHHYALIVAVASAHGFTDLPPQFGVAPSTLKYRAKQSGANEA